MKARKVKNLDPGASFAVNARRIVATRIDEVRALAPKSMKETRVKDQHNLRIAIKRLRYVLEITEACFGPDAVAVRRGLTELQELLGELRDCDAMLPRVRRQIKVAEPADRDTVRGLEIVRAQLRVERMRRFDRFREGWHRLDQDQAWAGLDREVRAA